MSVVQNKYKERHDPNPADAWLCKRHGRKVGQSDREDGKCPDCVADQGQGEGE